MGEIAFSPRRQPQRVRLDAKTRAERELIRLCSMTRFCPGCGQKKRLMPDDITCEDCQDDNRYDGSQTDPDNGWRR